MHKSFGPLEVLRGVDLEVRAGEVTVSSARPAPASPRCCAPSTTWRRSTAAGSASTASWSATAGSGDKLHELRERDILRQRTRIGFVFQNFNLFPHLTVLENVVEAPVSAQRRPRKEAVEAAAASCWPGSGSPTRPTPTRGSCPAASSSAWPSPARSPCEPKVLLFDEPTSALDPELVGEVLDVIKDLPAPAPR